MKDNITRSVQEQVDWSGFTAKKIREMIDQSDLYQPREVIYWKEFLNKELKA